MHGLLIFNPQAGRGRRGPLMEALARRAGERGLALELLPTRRTGDAARLVSSRLDSGPELVVVAGGDGTVAEVAGVLAGTEVPLAVVPAGTANVVAREFGVRSMALAEEA